MFVVFGVENCSNSVILFGVENCSNSVILFDLFSIVLPLCY